jgi:hypothetical protein
VAEVDEEPTDSRTHDQWGNVIVPSKAVLWDVQDDGEVHHACAEGVSAAGWGGLYYERPEINSVASADIVVMKGMRHVRDTDSGGLTARPVQAVPGRPDPAAVAAGVRPLLSVFYDATLSRAQLDPEGPGSSGLALPFWDDLNSLQRLAVLRSVAEWLRWQEGSLPDARLRQQIEGLCSLLTLTLLENENWQRWLEEAQREVVDLKHDNVSLRLRVADLEEQLRLTRTVNDRAMRMQVWSIRVGLLAPIVSALAMFGVGEAQHALHPSPAPVVHVVAKPPPDVLDELPKLIQACRDIDQGIGDTAGS